MRTRHLYDSFYIIKRAKILNPISIPSHTLTGFWGFGVLGEWRSDRVLRRLEALMLVANKEKTFLISGSGDVIEPEDGVIAIGSGGNYALAAARALVDNSDLDAKQIVEKSLHIAAGICVFTNDNLTIEELTSIA